MHAAVDTLGHLLALHGTAADRQGWRRSGTSLLTNWPAVERLCETVVRAEMRDDTTSGTAGKQAEKVIQ